MWRNHLLQVNRAKTIIRYYNYLNSIVMKKINPKDLALNKETVSNLNSDAASDDRTYNIDCYTNKSCQTFCQQATCPDYTNDPDTDCRATYQSVCGCISVNMYCESKGCDPSNTVGPVCCEPGITVDNDNCFPIQPTDPCVPQTLNENCELMPMTDENMEMSKCICEAESRECK